MARARGGVKSFDDLVDAVGDDSSVDGNSPTVTPPRSMMSRTVPLKDLCGNPYNPRGELGDLSDLATIADTQLQPVVVVSKTAFLKEYPDAAGLVQGRWVVVLGNRRLAAAHQYGRETLDIVIRDEFIKDRGTLLGNIITENIGRKGFDVMEEARAVEDLVVELGSADRAAEQLGKSKTWVSQRRALLQLAPELQEALRKGDLAVRDAREMARVPREEQVARWNASRKPTGDDDENTGAPDAVGEGSGHNESARESAAPLRTLTRAVRNFDAEPQALAAALLEQIGETGTRTLVSQLRKLLKG